MLEEAGLHRIPVVSRLLHIPGMLFSLRHTRAAKLKELSQARQDPPASSTPNAQNATKEQKEVVSPQSVADAEDAGRFYGHHDVYVRC